MKISVIGGTRNCEDWLEKVLRGHARQTRRAFKVAVEDGSRPVTQLWVELHARNCPVPLRHIAHEDEGYKEYLLATNGYDERLGGSDHELGERLENCGALGTPGRHRAVCMHMDHSRACMTGESVQSNPAVRAETRKKEFTWKSCGIKKSGLRFSVHE